MRKKCLLNDKYDNSVSNAVKKDDNFFQTEDDLLLLPPDNVDNSQNSRIIEFPEEFLANANKEDLAWLPRGESTCISHIEGIYTSMV